MEQDLTQAQEPEIERQRPSTAGMTTKVVKGSLWTLAGQVAPLCISLFTTPFVIRMLGAEGYGVLVLMTLITTYLSFADFGMGMASTKYGSDAFGQGDSQREARVIRLSAVIAITLSVIVAVNIWIFSGLILDIFNIPDSLRSDAVVSLRITSALIVISNLYNIFNTPQLVRLRMDLNAMITLVPRALGLIATPVVIYLGYGIVGAMWVLLFTGLATLFTHILVSWRLLPELAGFSVEKDYLPILLRFGLSLSGASVAWVALLNIEKGILTATVSVEALAHYAIAFALAGMLTMFSAAMMQSLVPAFSQLIEQKKFEEVSTLFSRSIRISLIWIMPVIVGLTVIAKPFFIIWAGKEIGLESIDPFYALLAGIFFNVLMYAPYSIVMASGRPDVLTKIYWTELIPYILLVWILSVNFGVVGAAIAWSLRSLTDTLILFYVAKRLSGAGFPKLPWMKLIVANGIMIFPVVLNYSSENLLVSLSVVAIAFIIYLLIIRKFLLEDDEVQWIYGRYLSFIGRA